MRTLVLGLTAFLCLGTANANPYETLDYRASDYSALAYYQLSFGPGSVKGLNQAFGLRIASDRALQAGAPAMLRLEFTPSGYLSALALSGMNLQPVYLALNAAEPAEGDVGEVPDSICWAKGKPDDGCTRDGYRKVVYGNAPTEGGGWTTEQTWWAVSGGVVLIFAAAAVSNSSSSTGNRTGGGT